MGILTVLQSHKFVMAEKLANKFEISIRTVYRDIKALAEIGIPVSFESNKGYFIVQGYFLPPVSFTSDEANSLILMAALADRFADTKIAKHSNNALQKIRAVLRHTDKEKSERLSDKIKVLVPDPLENTHLSEVQYAIAEQISLYIEYTDSQGRKTTREIEPIGMIYYTDQWHVIAWCWKRSDYRDFKIRNIHALSLTGKFFRKKNHIRVEDHIRSWK